LATSLTYRDKNVQRKSIPSITNFRTGIELNLNNNQENLTQTLLWNVGHTYSFPNILIPFVPRKHNDNFATRTNFALNGSNIDRLNYYQLKSITGSWGYEWRKVSNNNETVFLYKPINAEFYSLVKYSKLDSLLIKNPFLRSSFNEGNVMSQSFTYLHTGPSANYANQNNYIRIGIEEAGGITTLVPSLANQIYTYFKAELELRKVIKYEKTELAFRFLGGWGNNYSKSTTLGGQLPFFKQFTAGGPYSMRAWGLRQLGLGSSQFYDTSARSQNFDRFGDLQLEANMEYRFNLFQWGSYKMGSAFFVDMGNIWNTRDVNQDPNAGFKLDRLYQDLAIGMGTGLRFDFNYFIVRIDVALKMKDPTRNYNKGWLDLKDIRWTETKPNGLHVNNYAWQFGTGLPF
jgi:outer membrane protein assembly factor BamA